MGWKRSKCEIGQVVKIQQIIKIAAISLINQAWNQVNLSK